MTTQPKQRGGRREGAGRVTPPGDPVPIPKEKMTLVIDSDLKEWLEPGSGNAERILREAYVKALISVPQCDCHNSRR